MAEETFLERVERLARAESGQPPPEVQVPTELGVRLESVPDAPSSVAPPCGHQAPAGAKFCPECGQSTETVPQWRCGHDNPGDAKFCSECGMPAFAAPAAVGFGATAAARVAGDGLSGAEALRPKPEAELSAAERAERTRQHAAAVSAGSRDPGVGPYERPRPGQETELIHFLEDGLSFAGVVWYRGQEIEFVVGSPRWQEAQAWVNLTDFEQVQRWGHVKFRHGPWPGLRYVDVLAQAQQERMRAVNGDGEVPGPSEQELKQAQELEARRGRGVPVTRAS